MELTLNNCDVCGKPAKATLPYGPHRFCAEHFIGFFERRVKRTTAKSDMVKYGEKIAIGVSGGKDSMATLYLLHKFFRDTNKIEAIMIDEGIHGYRDNALQIGVKYCEANSIPYHVIRFEEEFGLNMEDVMKKITGNPSLGSTCSFCGVFRRYFLNSKALEIGADKLATGHNLDDECQSIAMSLFDNDLARIARSGETMQKKYGGMVPRIKPLYETPEKEIIAYTAMIGLGHYSEECCPFSWMAKRNYYRKMLNDLEDSQPGTKFKMLEMHRKLKPLLEVNDRQAGNFIKECETCGNLSNGKICAVCKQLERLCEMKGLATQRKSMKKENALSCAQTKGTI